MVADRTGGGKSLILSMTAICVAGVTLAVVPLLALTANQLARLNLTGGGESRGETQRGESR